MRRKIILYLCIALVFIIVWDWMILSTTSLKYLIPRPVAVAQDFVNRSGCYIYHSLFTGSEIILGLAISFILAVILAWTMDYSVTAKNFLQPLFVTIKCIPMFTLAPLMVMWFGWSFFTVLIPICLSVTFPLTLTLYKGLAATPKSVLEYFKLQKATEWQIFWKLKLPCAIPYLFSGVRVAITLAGIGAIAGEWAGAQQGLGMFIMENRYNRDLEGVFGALICLIALKLTLYGLAILIEKRVTHRRSYVFV